MKTFIPSALILLACLVSPARGFSQVQAGGSYMNLTRLTGGPVVTGDQIEMRAVISIPSGTSISSLVFTDVVPSGTSFISGSLQATTNEGVVLGTIPNTGNYTDAAGDDRGQISGSNITIYMGTGATASAGGSITGGTTTPVFYSTATILMAVYRITVTGGSGAIITTGGKFSYVNGSAQSITLTPNTISVNTPFGCAGSIGGNLLTDETGGTFSTGTAQNRGASANVTGFTYQNISTGNPVDGQYSIVKNTSPTQYTGGSPASTDKVFGVWDIIGDHTGTSTGAGNPPAAAGANKGYMLAVNASYAPATVFTTTVSGLTAHTGYTFSFWLRNICGNCGANPATNASSGTPGVKPNLAFELNGNDFYTSGEMTYTGTWVQRSFNFNTGGSTSFTFAIKNNAPGGGGNDWVIDDLNLVQCSSLLPLSLVSFNGIYRDNAVLLDWNTANESGVSHYEVERSSDGLSFTKIATQFSKQGQSANHYTYTDSRLDGQPQYFYRLRMVDIDGNFSYSNTITVKTAVVSGDRILIAPNPASGSSSLYLTSTREGNSEVEIYSLSGARVWNTHVSLTAGTNRLPLGGNTANFPRGMYLVKVLLEGQTYYSKLMLQ